MSVTISQVASGDGYCLETTHGDILDLQVEDGSVELNLDGVRELMDLLQRWLDTRRFNPPAIPPGIGPACDELCCDLTAAIDDVPI